MLIVDLPNNWIPERKWIAKVVLSRISKNFICNETNCNYWKLKSTQNNGSIILPDYFFMLASKERSIFTPRPLNDELTTIYGNKNNKKYVFPKVFNGEFRCEIGDLDEFIDIDIFGTAFWCMARVEEYKKSNRDIHDRWISKNSHAFRNGYLDRPIVDEMVIYLKSRLEHKFDSEEYLVNKFTQRLTHDVDNPYLYSGYSKINYIKLLLSHTNSGIARKIIINHLKKTFNLSYEDPFDKFDWLMDCAEKEGVKSEFYFIPSQKINFIDCRYTLEDNDINKLMKRILSRGHILGMHHSYGASVDQIKLQDGINYFKKIVGKITDLDNITLGGRFHYLRWNQSITPNILENCSIKYDGSLGYAEVPGFRASTCFDYNYFDIVKRRETKLEIRPLVLMEASVISRRYMNIKCINEAYNYMYKVKKSCIGVGGNFNLLWHNSSLASPKHQELYKSLIKSS